MSEAACAEEEESLKRHISVATLLLETLRRVERKEIEVDRDKQIKSRDHAVAALEQLEKADRLLRGSITACAGCPT